MIRLHHYWRSSASYRVRIALGLAGLPWDSAHVDLTAGEQRSEAHLALNPQGLVPVLEIDGLVLTQSLAIVEYLDETRGVGLLPADAAVRARVRALAHAIAMEIHPICNPRVVLHAVERSGGGITMEGWMRTFIGRGLAEVEAMLGDGPFACGERITLADICLAPQVYNADRWGVDLGPMPSLRSIADRLTGHPAFTAAHPEAHRPAA